MPKRDTIANHSVIIAKWHVHRLEKQRELAAVGKVGERIALALTGPIYDRPEVVEIIARHLRKSFASTQLRASAAVAQAAMKSNPQPLSSSVRQLLQDASEVMQLGRKVGSHALAKSLQNSKPRRYGRVATSTLKKSLDRAFARLRKLQARQQLSWDTPRLS